MPVLPEPVQEQERGERHQNSLHLRRFSWSCAALHSRTRRSTRRRCRSRRVAALADSRALPPPTASFELAAGAPHDICGYCGKSFPLPANWDVRSEHLVNEHKYGECNQHKKFYPRGTTSVSTSSTRTRPGRASGPTSWRTRA